MINTNLSKIKKLFFLLHLLSGLEGYALAGYKGENTYYRFIIDNIKLISTYLVDEFK